MKKLLVAGLAILGSLGVVGTAVADSVTLTYEPGTLVPVAAITDFSPSGASMVGMAVTAYFSDGKTEKLYWAASGATWGVNGTDWSLFESGDTYSNPWTLTSTSAAIQKIVLDGLPGKTVFDISAYNVFFKEDKIKDPDAMGTSGSVQGWTFQETGSPVITNNYTVTYSQQLPL